MCLCRCLAVLLLMLAGACHAQMPSHDEMQRATAAAEPQARSSGIVLRTGTLWLAALRERAPLLAAYGGGVCQLGYSAYTPGRDYQWLFPALPAAQRSLWLAGLVHHELAHCAEQAQAPVARGGTLALAEGGQASAQGQRWHEVLGDLAFALHVDRASADGEAMIRQLAALRAAQHAQDPVHDSSRELLCYLQQRQTVSLKQPWLSRLHALRERCWQD